MIDCSLLQSQLAYRGHSCGIETSVTMKSESESKSSLRQCWEALDCCLDACFSFDLAGGGCESEADEYLGSEDVWQLRPEGLIIIELGDSFSRKTFGTFNCLRMTFPSGGGERRTPLMFCE